MEMEYVEKWWSEYRGVRFEINKVYAGYNSDSWFTFYLLLFKERMRETESKIFSLRKKKYDTRSFYPTNAIDAILDFHGGCTFYEKEKYGYKIGCDYNHLHDKEYGHSLDSIERDVKKCIDEFLEKFAYKRWCKNCGSVVSIFDGKVNDIDEGVYSFCCQKCLDKKS